MTEPVLKHRLSTLDATFLYYEKAEAPFHVGSTIILDGDLTAKEFAALLNERMSLIPRYRQKVVFPPFNLGYPTWEYDPYFDIHEHVFEVQLDPPGTLEQLRVLTCQIESVMLDRSKPLWEMYIVRGLQQNRSALITKVHHSMVDGVSGVELLNISFDHSPDAAPLPKPASARPPVPERRPQTIIGSVFDTWLDSLMDRSESLFNLQRGLLNLGSDLLKQYSFPLAKRSNNAVMTLATPVSMLPFNQPNSGNLDINWQKFSFRDAHAIEEKLGGTVNGVMLCAVTGAVIRYLEKHGYDTEDSTLRFFVPVNTRHEEDMGTMGNVLSALPVDVPLKLHNCLERYAFIVRQSHEMNKAGVPYQFSLLLNLIGTLPPSLQALVGSLMYTPIPLVNMVCTNVPGPHTPLYILGRKMIDHYAYVPFAYAVGATCVIFSYNGQLYISLSSDGAKMPGLGQEFMHYLQQAFAELREYAGVLSTDIPTVEPLPEEADIPAIPEKDSQKPKTRPAIHRRKAPTKPAVNGVAKLEEIGVPLDTLPHTVVSKDGAGQEVPEAKRAEAEVVVQSQENTHPEIEVSTGEQVLTGQDTEKASKPDGATPVLTIDEPILMPSA